VASRPEKPICVRSSTLGLRKIAAKDSNSAECPITIGVLHKNRRKLRDCFKTEENPVMSEAEAEKNQRPQFRNINISQIIGYRLPLAGFISILHRISGLLMFLLLPFILFLLDTSLVSESSFEYFQGITSNWFVKLIILALSWAYLHHFCAGIRHLIMDNHIGLDKDSARKSAVGVFAISLPLALVVALKLFGAF
jgi:succinate dehydrogenase / fumarate reductase, cytochrome b subunit